MRCDYCGWMNASGVKRCAKCNQVLPEAAETEQAEINQDLSFDKTVTIQSNSNLQPVDEEMPSSQKYCINCGYPLAEDAVACPACGEKIEVASTPKSPMQKTPVIEPKTPVNAFTKTVIEPLAAKSDTHDIKKVINTKATIRDINAFANKTATMEEVKPQEETPEIKQPAPNIAALKQTVRDFDMVINSQPEEQVPVLGFKLVPADNYDGKAKEISFKSDNVILNRENIDPENITLNSEGHASLSCEDGEWFISNLSPTQTTYICTGRKIKIEPGDVIIVGNRRFIFQ